MSSLPRCVFPMMMPCTGGIRRMSGMMLLLRSVMFDCLKESPRPPAGMRVLISAVAVHAKSAVRIVAAEISFRRLVFVIFFPPSCGAVLLIIVDLDVVLL